MHEQSFSAQIAGCRALFPKQRDQVVRMLGSVGDYVRSSTISRSARFSSDEGHAEEADGDKGGDDGGFDEDEEEEETVREITQARTRILAALTSSTEVVTEAAAAAASPLQLKRKTLDKMGTLAAVTTSVVDDLGKTGRQYGVSFGGTPMDESKSKEKCAVM